MALAQGLWLTAADTDVWPHRARQAFLVSLRAKYCKSKLDNELSFTQPGWTTMGLRTLWNTTEEEMGWDEEELGGWLWQGTG